MIFPCASRAHPDPRIDWRGMPLQIEVVALVLMAALLHACWNACVKVGGDRLVTLAIVNGVAGLIGAVALPFVGIPEPGCWPYLAASAVLHTAYYFLLVQQYRVGDLSHVYPLARGLSPLLVAGSAALFAGEFLAPLAWVGVCVASLGIISLAFERGLPWRNDPRPVLFATATAICIAAYSVVDGLGVRLAGNAFAYIAWLYLIDGIPIAVFAQVTRRGQVRALLKAEFLKGVTGGTLQMMAYGTVIWAMSVSAMGAVSTLRETSVIFAAMIGALVLGERFGGRRITAAVLVAAGVIVLNSAR